MENTISYQRINVKEGIDLHLLRTPKFKTTMIKVFLQEQLRKETAPMVSLISYLLFRGTNKRPTTLEMMRYLEGLYGADLSTDVDKRGETQCLSVAIEIINQHYLPGGDNLLGEALEMILDVLTNPLSKDGKFHQEYFDQEKIVLRDDINSLINDKGRYATERCNQLMCPDEPFGIYKYGSVEDLEKITNEGLYTYYQHLLKSNPMHIFVIGDVEEDDVREKVEKAFSILEPRSLAIEPVIAHKEVKEPQTVIEEENIRQGKLAIGYRTNINRRSPEYAAAQIFNGIFGSLPHSKLFTQVREKSGLAYYIFTRLDSTKGIMQVVSGIESSDLEKVLQIVDDQLQEIREGKISTQEIEFTKMAYNRYFKYLADDNESFIDSCMVEVTNNLEPVLDELIAEMNAVTIDEIQEVARKVQLDMIYFLKGKEGADDEAGDEDEEDA